jgi:hypothetical protein
MRLLKMDIMIAMTLFVMTGVLVTTAAQARELFDSGLSQSLLKDYPTLRIAIADKGTSNVTRMTPPQWLLVRKNDTRQVAVAYDELGVVARFHDLHEPVSHGYAVSVAGEVTDAVAFNVGKAQLSSPLPGQALMAKYTYFGVGIALR